MTHERHEIHELSAVPSHSSYAQWPSMLTASGYAQYPSTQQAQMSSCDNQYSPAAQEEFCAAPLAAIPPVSRSNAAERSATLLESVASRKIRFEPFIPNGMREMDYCSRGRDEREFVNDEGPDNVADSTDLAPVADVADELLHRWTVVE